MYFIYHSPLKCNFLNPSFYLDYCLTFLKKYMESLEYRILKRLGLFVHKILDFPYSYPGLEN